MNDVKRVFQVDGKPFFSIGGQAHNSSGYNAAEAETAFAAVAALHGNTLAIPVYWEQVEPEEGTFCFDSVDMLLDKARRRGIKLVLLWFATWKNGAMEYAPAWVKQNPERFQRVVTPAGNSLWVLSSHCQANWEADRDAFVALCRHLASVDADEHTVIGLQIENEPGILGCDRDYGPTGSADFADAVPPELMAKMQAKGDGYVHDAWQQAGGMLHGTWADVFGDKGGEIMSAWSIARYIDGIAAAGRQALDVPMYTNVWLGEVDWRIPGEDYPSGGAVSVMLDVWKWFAPHLDVIAPDIYTADSRGYEAVCAAYARDDNPLYFPESASRGPNAWNMFRAIGQYDCIGYHCFGVENVLAADGSVAPEHRGVVDSFRALAAGAPLLLEYQGTGRIHTVIEEEFQAFQFLDLDGYVGLAVFHEFGGRNARDWHHDVADAAAAPKLPDAARGRGLIVQTNTHEFYLLGAGYRLRLRRKKPVEQMRDPAQSHQLLRNSNTQYLSMDEGHFEHGQFIVDRRRNGDESTFGGAWVEADNGVVRVRMCD